MTLHMVERNPKKNNMVKGRQYNGCVGTEIIDLLFTAEDADYMITGVIPISLFLLATGTVLRKAAIDRGVRLATGRYGCRQINKPSNSTVSVLIECVFLHFGV